MRKGFSLIFALFVIVLVAGIISLSLRYAKSSIIKTTTLYEKESAELFLNSAVELSLLAISAYERNSTNGCLRDINITSKDQRFIASVQIKWYYLLNGSNDATYCSNDGLTHIITTSDSHGMAMLEVEVEANTTHPKNSMPLRIIRRTLQRP